MGYQRDTNIISVFSADILEEMLKLFSPDILGEALKGFLEIITGVISGVVTALIAKSISDRKHIKKNMYALPKG